MMGFGLKVGTAAQDTDYTAGMEETLSQFQKETEVLPERMNDA